MARSTNSSAAGTGRAAGSDGDSGSLTAPAPRRGRAGAPPGRVPPAS
jgi:hypothetical protein